ncbi:acetyl-CoA carboxylase biotin carboxylase subunit [Actinomycetospora callitridis]|uniref:acetyl-CoA carboxylase biotin carboxylase subunit n=1 Tax=Actinomycetospora callitridis TaxID=913944 RepID=UPI0023658E0C|nr:acetyl-CoA carboxylase biotin carboxylase subunit [Actinomycetospora callitridis]MDD7921136.1 acetyl-CoA carboxylase biotin carboxylase subunit [Actinomycetospora callitridis]
MSLRSVLVANRGEIALRVVRACRELGIRSVAVYSDADASAAHVRHADDAVHIGKSSASKSYLNADAVLEAARSAGVDAVHPGYGFLSERPSFAAAVEEAGLTFVGPPSSVIATMGDKAAARAVARSADVPVVPGSDEVSSADYAVAAAEEVGYPVLVKASAGGGGRGIRPAASAGELRTVVVEAQREASSAFGSDKVYLERALQGPRHVEVQVLADTHGSVVHCFERECSLQRRRQKILEEAPAPGLSSELRSALCDAAVRLSSQVGYVGAGTVEFLVEGEEFFFIEMNTRIQVEHPVTEWITGLDLVAEQLRIAGGEPLSVAQDDIVRRGASIEFRVNAEDPDQDFLPSPGEVTGLELPGGPGVRVDTALMAGDVVPPFYDSLVAKLAVWAPTREQALARGRRALAEYRVEGLPTTIGLHRRLLDEPAVVDGTYDITTLETWLAGPS